MNNGAVCSIVVEPEFDLTVGKSSENLISCRIGDSKPDLEPSGLVDIAGYVSPVNLGVAGREIPMGDMRRDRA
jgi:hypothetical protein